MTEKENLQYNDLFDDSAKIKAFDLIAQNFYFKNFGSMQKSDIDTLMFSIFIEQILKQSEDNLNSYSDYVLSKMLGISQTRISNLKIKKELKYPYNGFDWKKAFLRILGNARFEGGKIKMYIPDTNLYLEIKNAIEMKGDYVDVTLNSKLLQVSPECFLDLVVEISDYENMEGDKQIKDEVRRIIKSHLERNQTDVKFLEQESFSKQLKQNGLKLSGIIISEIISSLVPVVGKGLGEGLCKILNLVTIESKTL